MQKSVFSSIIAFMSTALIIQGIFAAVPAQGQNEPDSNLSLAPPETANRPNPIKSDPDSIQRGKAIFIEYCTPCHGNEGYGDGPVAARLPVETPDLTKVAGTHKDGVLAWKISNGRSPMPKWGDKLSEEQIWDLVNFIQDLGSY